MEEENEMRLSDKTNIFDEKQQLTNCNINNEIETITWSRVHWDTNILLLD